MRRYKEETQEHNFFFSAKVDETAPQIGNLKVLFQYTAAPAKWTLKCRSRMPAVAPLCEKSFTQLLS